MLGFSYRSERLRQERNAEDLNIAHTYLFPDHIVLAPERQRQFQFQLQYSW